MYRMISAMTNAALPDGGDIERPTVVVIDDDVSVRESLELLIVSAGWRLLVSTQN